MRLLRTILIATAVGARAVDHQQVPLVIEAVGGDTSYTKPALEGSESATPIIGVHFTSSYAAAAARYHNGTIRDLNKTKGDAEYIELMARWLHNNSKHGLMGNVENDCGNTPGMMSQDLPSRWRCNVRMNNRRLRSLFGLPASRDAAILTTFISKVRLSIEAELDSPIASIAPVLPELRKDQARDFENALDLAGLRQSGNHILVDANAAYAGLGAGLCKDVTDLLNCKSEEKTMHSQGVLFLNFDNSSFSASVRYVRDWRSIHRSGRESHYPELGWWNLPVFEVARARFWAQIHEAVVNVMSGLRGPPSRIVLMGDHGADEEFKAVVEAAIWSASEYDVRALLQGTQPADAGKTTARGATELAWRSKVRSRESGNHKAIESLEL